MEQKHFISRSIMTAAIVFLTGIFPLSFARADTSGPNLIANPSLETASADPSTPLGWNQGKWGTNTAVFSYPVAGSDGAGAANLQITSYADGDAKWYFDPVAVSAGTYQFSDSYKSDTKTYLVAQFTDTAGAFSYASIATLNPAPDWAAAKAIVTVPSGTARITVFHLINSVGSLTVDNYSLQVYTAPVVPPPTPDNLITNPSLEYAGADGQPVGWFQGGWGNNTSAYSYPITGYNGNAASVQTTSYTDGDAKWYFAPVTAKSNWRYLFSDYYRSDTASVVEAQVQLQDGTYQYIRAANLPAAGTWTKFSGEIVTPPNAKSITIFHLIAGVGTLATDEYSLAEIGSAAFAKGMVSLNFDDGWLNTYRNGYPILKTLGLKSTYYVMADALGDTGYMTLAQVKTLQSSGNEIGSHTKTHADLTTLTPEQLTDEVSGSKTWFTANGINAATFAYPFGSYNAAADAAVKSAGYAGARTSDPGYNSKVTNKYKLVMQSVENTTTLAQVKQWINQAKQNKTWLILLFHKVQTNTSGEQYSTTPAMIAQIGSYLKTQQVPVITNSQGLGMMGQ
ncbi:MAG: polysaccharide deacetylase family protein [Candidatus Pacebacteria bacterium]|jgi:peptidoglycan/xylan/chitin deacetylase (PgdA/CDA1 family)|nr:polysaccharide deacetylase family protein [Candidatus Paceibacterota bacterium]